MKYLLALLTLLPLLAWSASFDCQKARSAPEKMVCTDPELSKLDDQLAQTYRDALNTMAAQDKAEQRATPEGQTKLTQEQRHWGAYVRNVCEDAACLREAYQTRIELLKKNPSPFTDISTKFIKIDLYGDQVSWAVDYSRDPNEKITEFRQILRQKGKSGEILGCDKLIYFSMGWGNPENYYVAGNCTFESGGERSLVQICYDNMDNNASIIKTINQAGASYEKLTDLGIKCIQNE